MSASLVTRDRDAAARRAAELQAAGWRGRDGFDLPAEPFELADRRWCCHGTVDSDDAVAAAVLAAARGAVVVAVVTDEELGRRLHDDLARVGPADLDLAGGAASPAAIDPEARRVLALVAEGANLPEVAAQLHLSLRTAERRLAAARRQLGATSTADAVARYLARR